MTVMMILCTSPPSCLPLVLYAPMSIVLIVRLLLLEQWVQRYRYCSHNNGTKDREQWRPKVTPRCYMRNGFLFSHHCFIKRFLLSTFLPTFQLPSLIPAETRFLCLSKKPIVFSIRSLAQN